MGQIKNIKLHIVTDIKTNNSNIPNNLIMSDVEVGSKRSGEYDEYGEISSYKKRPRNDRDKMRFLGQGRNCGAIIGKGGENIKRLRKENSITINVQDTKQEGVLTLSGDRSTCVSVFKEVLPMIPESPYPVNPKEKCAFEVNLLVQTDQVGCVIAKGGQRIREIRDESSGKVRVYQDCLPNSNERIVAIGGEDETRVLAALDIILKTLDDHPLKTQVHYYDPKNNDGPPGGMERGGHHGPPPPPQQQQHHEGPGNSQLGAGLGGLGNLGGLGGLGTLAGAAGILGQLGLGGLAGGAGLGAGALGAAGLGGLGSNVMGGGGGNDGGGRNERDYGNYQHQRNEGRGGDRGGDRGDRGGRGRDQRNGNEQDDRMADFGDMETETKITVGNDMCGAIIGKRGQRIREIREASGARVETSETEKGNTSPRIITITGTQRQIVVAQQMMAECVRNRTT